MARIPQVTERDQLPEGQRQLWDEINGSRGSVRGPFALLLHSPELAGRAAHLGAYIRFESEAHLPPLIRELATCIAARLLDCGYEWSAHAPAAVKAGASEATVAAIRQRQPQGLPADQRWLWDFVEQVLEQHRVSAGTFEEARRGLDLQGVVELVATIGYYSMLAATLNTFEMEPTEI